MARKRKQFVPPDYSREQLRDVILNWLHSNQSVNEVTASKSKTIINAIDFRHEV